MAYNKTKIKKVTKMCNKMKIMPKGKFDFKNVSTNLIKDKNKRIKVK